MRAVLFPRKVTAAPRECHTDDGVKLIATVLGLEQAMEDLELQWPANSFPTDQEGCHDHTRGLKKTACLPHEPEALNRFAHCKVLHP